MTVRGTVAPLAATGVPPVTATATMAFASVAPQNDTKYAIMFPQMKYRIFILSVQDEFAVERKEQA